MLDIIPTALADTADATTAAAPQSGGMVQIGLLVIMIVAFYFLLWRPQAKSAKAHRDMIADLKVGDQVITGGGLQGTIEKINDHDVILALDPSATKVTVQKQAISSLLPKGTLSPSESSETKQ